MALIPEENIDKAGSVSRRWTFLETKYRETTYVGIVPFIKTIELYDHDDENSDDENSSGDEKEREKDKNE